MSSKIEGSIFVPSGDNAACTIEYCGDDLLSINVASPAEAQALAEQLRASGAWREVVPGIASVVVQFDAIDLTIDVAMRRIADEIKHGIAAVERPDVLLEIPVVYGGDFGPDLDDVCEQTGLSADELIALHTGQEYRVDLVGFTPGFAYVGGLDDLLHVPRRKQPRQHVEAGSVGIADGRTGLYALSGPGGWPLIGRTTFRLFDPQAEEPFPIRAGMRIKFVSISAAEAGL
jgi:allophanate hydrolase